MNDKYKELSRKEIAFAKREFVATVARENKELKGAKIAEMVVDEFGETIDLSSLHAIAKLARAGMEVDFGKPHTLTAKAVNSMIKQQSKSKMKLAPKPHGVILAAHDTEEAMVLAHIKDMDPRGLDLLLIEVRRNEKGEVIEYNWRGHQPERTIGGTIKP